jgi:hypothetical protein
VPTIGVSAPELERLRRVAWFALGATFVFSFGLHVGVYLLPRLLVVLGLWTQGRSLELVDLPGEVGFDVELDYAPPAPPAPPSEAAPAAPPATTGEAPKPPPPKPPPPKPAPAASLATPRRDGQGGQGGSKPTAEGRGGAGGQGSTGGVRDPMVVAGKAGSVVGRDVNLQVLVVTENLRSHPMAAELGPALANIPQWKTFFGPTAIDPIRDTDRIMAGGPQFRDVSKVSAAVKFRLSEPKLRDAIDDLRRASDPPGEWVSESPPTAKVRAGGADRYVVIGGNGLVMTVPEGALDQAKRGMAFAPSRPGEAIIASIRYPSRAVRGLPFAVPASLAVLRLSVTLRPDGGADVLIDATDKDAATAAESARAMTASVDAMSVREVPLLGRIRLFDPVPFRAEGEHVKAVAHFNAAQTREMARLIVAMFSPPARERERDHK